MRRMLVSVALLTLAVPAQAQPTPTVANQQQAQTSYQQGWKALASESFEEAVRAFSRATTLDPQFNLAFYGLGLAHMGLKHFPEATRAYERARDLYAVEFSDNVANQGKADDMMRDDERQIEVALQQYHATPTSMSGNRQVLALQAQYRRIQSKREMVQNINLGDPVPPFLHVALGSAYVRSGRLPDAEQQYKAAVTSDPKLGEAWNNLAVVYLETNRVDDAERAMIAAQKAGFDVPPGLRDEIRQRKSKK